MFPCVNLLLGSRDMAPFHLGPQLQLSLLGSAHSCMQCGRRAVNEATSRLHACSTVSGDLAGSGVFGALHSLGYQRRASDRGELRLEWPAKRPTVSSDL